MNAFAFEDPTYRRLEGTGHVLGLGQARAFEGHYPTTKNNNNMKELALSAEADSAVGAGGRWSDEPMRRPDHKAKRHPRPVRMKHKRRRPSRQAMLDELLP